MKKKIKYINWDENKLKLDIIIYILYYKIVYISFFIIKLS